MQNMDPLEINSENWLIGALKSKGSRKKSSSFNGSAIKEGGGGKAVPLSK